jgi:hypothetical protein
MYRGEGAVGQTPLDAAHQQLADLYRRLAFARVWSRERVSIEMEIVRVRKRIVELERQRGPDKTAEADPPK